MNHIDSFNKEVINLISLYPEDETLELIKRYKESKRYKDYYMTLDSLGFKIKFSYLVVFGTTEKNKNTFIPCVKFYPKNPFGEEPRTVELVENDNSFKSLNKCYSYLAKEYIYRLMKLENLKNLISI